MKRVPKTCAKRILVTFFVMIFLATPATPHGIRHAEALSLGGLGGRQVTIVGDVSTVGVTNTLKNTLSEISNAVSAGAQTLLKLKEITLDGLAWGIAQNALNQITADMINWVNGGFDGEPAFVTDLEGFLLGIADETAGEFIFGTELDNLCESIQFQVRAAIYVQFATEGRDGGSGGVREAAQCTFDDVAGADFEAFVEEGDFAQGGLDAFFQLTVGGKNDPIKAYLEERAELYDNIAARQATQREEVGWADGYLSKKNCTFIVNATGLPVKNCESVTPGALIRDTIAFHVGELPALKLVQADELNEIIGSLAGSLTNQALQGTFGLLGLGGNSRYADNRFGDGSQSYVDALRDEDTGIATDISSSELTVALAANNEYLELQEDILEDITELEDDLAAGEEQWPACFDLELTDDLLEDKEDAETNLVIATQVVGVLQKMKDLVAAGTVHQQNAVYQEYLKLQSEGLVKTSYDVTKLTSEFIELEFANRVTAFEDEIEREENKCD